MNFDSTDKRVPFEQFYRGLEEEMDGFDFLDGRFEFVESWRLDGEFNWKTLSEYISSLVLDGRDRDYTDEI